MSSILKRTIFICPKDDGTYRWFGWAQTVTGVGICAETFSQMSGQAAHDPHFNRDRLATDFTDDMRIVHDVKLVDEGQAFKAINFDIDNSPLHGGVYPVSSNSWTIPS
jgi:hypothetical protein